MQTTGKSTRKAGLLNAVRELRDLMVEFTQELVALPTENPPGNCYPQAVELIRRKLKALGFADTRVVGDCVLSFAGQGDRTLYWSGHYDVVPAQSPNQFEPRIAGENLFGRGSSDMKSGLAVMMYSAKALLECGLPGNGRICLVFVPDEETAGPRGSRYLVEQGFIDANAIGMLTPEPTGGLVWNASRGAITLKVSIKGKAAHVGRQHEGVNAFEQMMAVTRALQDLKREVETRTTAFHVSPEAARRSILLIGGRSQSGTNFNVVPEEAWFTVDRRINPEERLPEEKERLLAVFDRLRADGIDLEIQVLQEGEACGVPAGSALEQALTRSIQKVTGKAPKVEMCPGLLETRFYAAAGIPALAYGPGLLTVAHGPNEFVPIKRIVECAAVYALTAADLLS